MTILLLAVLPFVVIFAIVYFTRIRRVSCPDCGDLLPLFQSPFMKTRNQWIAGGYQCPRCGCETNLAGEKVTTDLPVTRSQRIQFLFLAVGLLAAVGLNAAILFGGTALTGMQRAPAKQVIRAIPQPAPVMEDGQSA